jgi:putative aldouronate transport system substrate-binding protein
MKRTIWIALCVLCLTCGLLFAGPGREEPTTTETPKPAAAPKAGTAPEAYSLPIAKDPIELRFLARDTGEAGKSFTKNKSLVWEEIAKKTNIRIKWDVAPAADYTNVFQLRMASKSDLPDIVEIVGVNDGSHLTKYAGEGILAPINELIDRYCPNLVNLFSRFPAYRDALTLPDGKMYSLGVMNATKVRSRGLLIRQDWLDNVGMQPPTTAEELLAVGLAFKQKDANKNGKDDEIPYSPQNDWKGYLRFGAAYGLHLTSSDGWALRNGKVEYDFVNPAFKDYLSMMHQMYVSGVIPKDFMTADTNMNTSRLTTGVSGITDHYLNNFALFNDPSWAYKKNNPESKWIPVDFKETAKYGKPTYDMEPIAWRNRTWGITTVNKYPIESMRLIDFAMANPEGKDINMSGVEGVTFSRDATGTAVMYSDWQQRMPADYFLGNAYLPYAHIFTIEWSLGLNKSLRDDPALMKWALDTWNKVAEDVTVAYIPPIPTVADGTRVTQLYGDLLTYRDEMVLKFINGDQDLSGYDAYVARMGSLGLTEIVKIYQKYQDTIKK